MQGTTVTVVLYGHAGCPGTQSAREYFTAQGIAFLARDVADPKARAEMHRWSAWATPFLIIDGRLTMVGFDAEEFSHLLERAVGGA